MKKIRNTCRMAVLSLIVVGFGTIGAAYLNAQEAPDHGGENGSNQHGTQMDKDDSAEAALFYSIAITVGVSCLSAGYAVGKVGASALGAAAEKPELLGRAIIFVGLAEGIAIYGLIIGIMLIRLL